jgi:hypothetical protein
MSMENKKIVVEATPLIDTTLSKSKKLPKYGKIFLDKKEILKQLNQFLMQILLLNLENQKNN